MTDLAVLGAGPAGLYAALLAARRGMQVVVFERAETVGGLSASFEIDGLAVDHGSHRLYPSIDPDIFEDLSALLGSELQSRRRHGRIRLQGRWVAFPLKIDDLVQKLPLSVLARLGGGALAAGFRKTDHETLATALKTGLGKPAGEIFYFPYASKIWGHDPGELSGEQARRRISAGSAGGILRKLWQGPSGKTFLYPAGGFGRIASVLADAAANAGAEIRLKSGVVGLSRVGKRWEIAGEGGSEVRSHSVLSTLPISVLAGLSKPPSAVEAAATSLRFRSMVLVYLLCRTPRFSEYDAHYFPEPAVSLTRLSEPKNYRDSPTDPPDRTVLCAELPCWRGDAIWNSSDADLLARVVADLRSQGLTGLGEEGLVKRIPFAYPVYPVGFEPSLETVEAWLNSQADLLTFGRQGLFAHDNTHHALAMAKEAVASVGEDGTIDHERWKVARESFRTHVVED